MWARRLDGRGLIPGPGQPQPRHWREDSSHGQPFQPPCLETRVNSRLSRAIDIPLEFQL